MFGDKKDKKQSPHQFYQNSKYDQDYNWIDYYKPGRRKGNTGWGEYPDRERGPGRRTAYRVVAVLSILALLLLVREFNHPVGENFRQGLRYVLTTDWNVGPALEKAVKFGLQMAGVDSQLDSGMPQDRTVKEAMGKPAFAREILIPVSGRVVRHYGWNRDSMDNLDRFHHGIDIAAAPGTPVKAALSGKVSRIASSPQYGQYVQVDHGEGVLTLYAGVASIKVKEGQQVKAGESIAEVARSGDVKEGGLHFELRENSSLVDPLTRLEFPAAR